MQNPTNRALVPFQNTLPARTGAAAQYDDRKPQDQSAGHAVDFALVRKETHLRDKADVEKYLPDILGRALARIWIDNQFRDRFAAGPVETLAAYGVFLPRSISIDFVTVGTPRPQVVVYEQKFPGAPRRKLLYLRLMMMAGR